MGITCEHCGDVIDAQTMEHEDEHPGRCCDCTDLSYGMPLAAINRERLEAGKKPIVKTWPGLDANGNRVRNKVT